MKDLLEIARRAVREASDLLREARPEDVRGKSNPRDLVTEWDLRSEELIRNILAPTGIDVLGEEGASGLGPRASSDPISGGPKPEARGPSSLWLVDPIDGTVNFAHGLPIWSISIALEQAGSVVLGVIAAPMVGWWFEASAGGGAFDERGAPLRVSAVPKLEQALLSTGFPYDRATSPINNFGEWERLQRVAGACRRLGSASLDLCMVARGWLDGYWERKVKPWDVAAGALIVKEAGGTVTDTHGGAFDLHLGEVVASNGAIHEGLIAELELVRRARSPE